MQDVGWAADTPYLFSATLGDGDHLPRHYLVVEALPQGGWDWEAWASDGTGRSLHGTAPVREDAMRAAQHAAALLLHQCAFTGMPQLAVEFLN